MATVTLHPFGAGPARNRAITPNGASPTPRSLWGRLAARYWAGWEHYARVYGAEIDQLPRFPVPGKAPVVTVRWPRFIGIR